MNRRFGGVILAGLLLAGLLLLPLARPARAAESRTGETIVIAAGEVVDDDLYVTANRFVLNGTVTGDVLVLGSTIEINGTVGGDLLAAGQSILVSGNVEDDARIAGAVLTLGDHARLADDLVAAGASLEARSGSTVAGDLLFAGAQALLAGEVTEDVLIGASSLALQGRVGGDVTASVEAARETPEVSPFSFFPNMPQMPLVPSGLTFSPAASIGGALTYTSPAQATIPEGLAAGGTHFNAPTPEETRPAQPQPSPAAQRVLQAVRRLAALILVGLLALWLFPRGLARAIDTFRTRPLPSLGWGLLGWIVVLFGLLLILLAMIVLAILLGILTLGGLVGATLSIGGVSLAVGITSFGLLLSYGSYLVLAIWIGQLILGRIRPAWGAGRVAPMILGLFLIVLLAAIPILGPVVRVVTVLLGFGAIALTLWEALRPRIQGRLAPAAV
jgi:cytoskeletal protein CcmA (bactofilin family)